MIPSKKILFVAKMIISDIYSEEYAVVVVNYEGLNPVLRRKTERGRKSVGILQFPVIFSPVTSDEYFIRGLYRCYIHWIFIK